MVRRGSRIEEANDSEVLKHENFNKHWTPEEKLELVSQVLAGKANLEVAIKAAINDGTLYQWVRKYKIYGYNGLVDKKETFTPLGKLKKPNTENSFI